VWVNLEEYLLVILILGTFSIASVSAYLFKKGQNPVKKAQKRNEQSLFDNLTEYREVEKGTILDILKQKDGQIKSLNARLKQFESYDDEDQPKKGVSWEEIQVLVKEKYPQYSKYLMFPPVKKQIMEITKGMSLTEIIEYVKQFAGNQQSGTGITEQSTEYNKDWA